MIESDPYGPSPLVEPLHELLATQKFARQQESILSPDLEKLLKMLNAMLR
jgi:hypothetical protein